MYWRLIEYNYRRIFRNAPSFETSGFCGASRCFDRLFAGIRRSTVWTRLAEARGVRSDLCGSGLFRTAHRRSATTASGRATAVHCRSSPGLRAAAGRLWAAVAPAWCFHSTALINDMRNTHMLSTFTTSALIAVVGVAPVMLAVARLADT